MTLEIKLDLKFLALESELNLENLAFEVRRSKFEAVETVCNESRVPSCRVWILSKVPSKVQGVKGFRVHSSV